jgi:hypothetical protein
MNENITFFIDENNLYNENKNQNELNINEISININKILNLEYEQKIKSNNDLYVEFIHYELNYTIKQLLLICDYYGIAKDLKNNKCNKVDILSTLIIYENNVENAEKVNKRKTLWHYMSELKNDKFMKKFLLWN